MVGEWGKGRGNLFLSRFNSWIGTIGPLSVHVLCFGIVRVCPYVVVLAGSIDTA